jgi:MSHA biogenesis protein MshQ
MKKSLLLVLLFGVSLWAEAANFNFNPPTLPSSSLCSTSWSYSNNVYTCTGNGRVTVSSGDNLRTNSNITIVADNGFSLADSDVGSSTNRINLVSTYGTISATTTTRIWGNVQSSSGAITISGTTIDGTLTTSSTLNATNGAITGNVSAQNGVTSNGTSFSGTITSNSGSISLTGGTVTGTVTTSCCTLTTNNTNLQGGATVHSGLSVTGGTIAGNYVLTSNNSAAFLNTTMTSGSVSGASTITVTNSTMGSEGSTVDLTTTVGNITLDNSTVYGDLTAPSSAQIVVDQDSGVAGTCTPYTDECVQGSGGSTGSDLTWRFNEAAWNGIASEVKDSSSVQLNGVSRNGADVFTLTPAISGNPGTCGYGDFIGQASGSTSDYVEIANSSAINSANNFSVSFWLNMTAASQPASTFQTIMAYGDTTLNTTGRFELYRNTDGNLAFEVRVQDGTVYRILTSGSAVFNGAWQYITATYSRDSRRMRLYLNGTLMASIDSGTIANGTNAKTPRTVTGAFAIGAIPGGANGITGLLDEVRFYAKELTTTEINTAKNSTVICASNGPAVAWDLNQGLWSGAVNEVLDFSGNNIHGRTFNGVLSAFDNTALSGDPGTCSFSQFNGTNQYIEAADTAILDISNELTLGFWVKPISRPASGLMTIVSKDANYEVHQQPDGKVQWWWNDSTGTARQLISSTALPLNQWTHVTVTYISGIQRIYFNGISDASSSVSGTLATNSSPLQLGQDQGVAGRYFNGYLDELRLYRRALSTRQIVSLPTERRTCNQCFTENFNTTDNWYASAYGGSELPTVQTSPQRLRLTRNIAEQATSMTIRKKFPGVGNKVSVEFNYYAWKPTTGGGADGVAVTLSDATYTPAPGSFGGSLGYAQRTSPSTDAGFNGGWIGIGLDEYGNFSNPSEGRQGGLGFRPQAVALRGSFPNYSYLSGTTVTPNLDSVGTSTPGPGHRYRITVDATTTTPTQRAYVKVERDTTGTGNSYITVINNYDAAAASGQQAVPEDFFLSFTASTGSSVNNHEIATIQVCTVQPAPEVVITPPSTVHHYRLSYASTGVTCEAEAITIEACADASCSSLSTAQVTTSISASNGGTFVGGNTLTFTGSTTVQLQQTNLGETTLAVSGGTSANQCSVAGCKITFASAGFKFYKDNSSTDGLLNQVAGVQGSGYLRAVQTNTNTMACEARVAGPRVVSMSYDCVNPGACITGQSLQLGATSFNGSEEGTSKNVSLTFDAQGYAPLSINYSDVGQLRLAAGLVLPASGNNPAATLLGQSDTFVVRPYRINVTSALSSANATPANAANPQSTATGAGFVAAGEAFQLYVSPVNANGALTPNYGKETVPETVQVTFGQLVHPAGGDAGTFAVGDAFSKVTSGPYLNQFHSTGFSWDEVGTINLLAKVDDDDYLGTGLGAAFSSTPYVVGRFYPMQFALANTSFENTCSAFSYMGQPAVKLGYEIQAKNLAGDITLNYDADYGVVAVPSLVLENADNGTDLSNRAIMAGGAWANGKYTLSQTNLSFNKLAVPDGPYSTLAAGIKITDSLDGRDFDTKTMNPTSAGNCGGSCTAAAVAGTVDMRYGRLMLQSALGAENERLRVTAETQYWTDGRFVRNTLDNCTSFNPEQWSAVKSAIPDAPAAPASIELSGNTTILNNGVSLTDSLWLEPPQVRSSYILQCATTIEQCIAQSWLQYDWDGDGTIEVDDLKDPGTEIVFGLRTGNKRQIFWQERLN